MKQSRARSSRISKPKEDEPFVADGTCAARPAVALVTTFARPEIVEPLRDDSEADDSVVYADEKERL